MQHVPVKIVEQAAILGVLNPRILSEPRHAMEVADLIAKRLDALELVTERGWNGKVLDDGGLAFSRILRGVAEQYFINESVIQSSEARQLDAKAAELKRVYGIHCMLTVKEKEYVTPGPVSLVDTIIEAGRKGVNINRYKGLGEMNPEQLWETTLDPNVRTLLQIKVAHASESEEVFSTLMGDVVEPRREFIQTNALKAVNLDV
jgi:DNA gyrase subunit B